MKDKFLKFNSIVQRFRKLLTKTDNVSKAVIEDATPQKYPTLCPNCGCPLELIQAAIVSEDPVVYKCAHCNRTITEPGTIFFTRTGSHTYSRQEKIVDVNTGKIKLVGTLHGSVGREYRVRFSYDAFLAYRKIQYIHPDAVAANIPGADEAKVEYTLEPLKCGLFCVTEEEYFQGEFVNSCVHFYLVE